MSADEVRAALRAAAHALAAVSMAYDVEIHGEADADAPSPSANVAPVERRTVEACILEAAPTATERPIAIAGVRRAR